MNEPTERPEGRYPAEWKLAEYTYDAELYGAARSFLMTAFTTPVLVPSDAGSQLIGAAMTIVCGINWYQPD